MVGPGYIPSPAREYASQDTITKTLIYRKCLSFHIYPFYMQQRRGLVQMNFLYKR